MSVSADEPSTEIDARCASCGSAMESDQEWCLECGAARTLLHNAPDWRIPLAIVGGVVVLALLVLAFALIELSSDANRSAASIVQITPGGPATTPATTPAATSPPPTTAATTSTPASTTATSATPTTTTAASNASPTGGFVRWPVGLGGFTVALYSGPTEAAANAVATKLSATVPSVGVLNSSQHRSMSPGNWVVFVGRYPSEALARAAAARLIAAGQSRARAEIVAPLRGG